VEEKITKGQVKIETSKANQSGNGNSKELEERGAKNKEIIASLRVANKKLREDSRDLPRQIQELRAHSQALEESNEAFETARKELHERFDSETEGNNKLNEIIQQYQAKGKEYEESVENRDEMGTMECKVKELYSNLNVKMVDFVKEKSNDNAFVDDISSIQDEAAAAATGVQVDDGPNDSVPTEDNLGNGGGDPQ
jgi:uncharacterized coiled-coil DUF342 family protein